MNKTGKNPALIDLTGQRGEKATNNYVKRTESVPCEKYYEAKMKQGKGDGNVTFAF